jgi:hypothetical protein
MRLVLIVLSHQMFFYSALVLHLLFCILMFCLVSDAIAIIGLRVNYRTTYKYDSMYRS